MATNLVAENDTYLSSHNICESGQHSMAVSILRVLERYNQFSSQVVFSSGALTGEGSTSKLPRVAGRIHLLMVIALFSCCKSCSTSRCGLLFPDVEMQH